MSKLLWGFEISPVDGKAIDTDAVTGYCEGFLVCANDFEARFQVRGDERKETIFREFREREGEFERFGLTGDECA